MTTFRSRAEYHQAYPHVQTSSAGSAVAGIDYGAALVLGSDWYPQTLGCEHPVVAWLITFSRDRETRTAALGVGHGNIVASRVGTYYAKKMRGGAPLDTVIVLAENVEMAAAAAAMRRSPRPQSLDDVFERLAADNLLT